MPYPGGNVIRVTPTLATAAISADNVVFFNATEIPNAVSNRGETSKLVGITVLNEDDVAHDFDLVFMQVESDLGTINAAVDITDANSTLAKFLGYISLDGSASGISLVNSSLFTTAAGAEGTTQLDRSFPLMLRAEEGSTSVYFGAILRDQTPTYTDGDLEFIFPIEYLG